MTAPATPRRRPPRAAAVLLVGLVAAAVAVAGCGSGGGTGDGRPTIVSTTPILGAVVRDLVGERAAVEVVMPNGADPHDFQPSARDAAALGDADLVVENGLGLEEGLGDALARARDDGTPVFTAADHVAVLTLGGGGGGTGDGPGDPHIWMDPLAMRDVAVAMAPVLTDRLGLDLGGRAADLDARLVDLDAEIRRDLAGIPAARRLLVTGHESMGYFARRYDFELLGALIPSLSSQAQASASNLAELRARVEAAGVPTIFTEAGTPDGVAEAIAGQAGARVVEIATYALPDDGSYETFMRDAAAAARDGLTGRG